MLGAIGTYLGTLGATASAIANRIRAVFTGLTVVAEVSVSADTVLADVTATANFFVGAVGTFLSAIGTDGGTVGATVSANTNVIHAVFTYTALGTVVTLTADTLPTDTTLGAELVIGTVSTFFSAFGTNGGTFRATVSASANVFNAVFTDTALGTVVTVSTNAVPTNATLGTKLIVGTSLAFFSALGTYDGTVGAAVSANANVVYAIFTDATFGAVVSLSANTVPADTALGAKLVIGTSLAFFSALGTDDGTFRASVSANANVLGTVFTGITFFTEITLSADTFLTDVTAAANFIVGAVGTFFSTLGTDGRTA